MTGARRLLVRLLVRLLAGLLLVPALAGCSEDPFEAYCAVVEEERPDLSEAVAAGSPTALIDALPSLEALEDAAPRDLRDEWDLVVGRVRELRDALEDAGVDPTAYDAERRPDGLGDEEAARIDAAARQLVSGATVTALAGIQQQARDVCGTPLTL